jgi:hypothetical protein
MLKSGLIMFFAALVGTVIGGIIFCCCAPAWAVAVGVVAGLLAGVFDKPAAEGPAAGKGAGAGVIAGAGALIGQVIAAYINTTVLLQNPEAAAEVYKMFGIQNFNPEMFGTTYGLIGTLLGGGCWGVLDLILAAGFGALGGFLWFRFLRKQAAGSTPQIL